MLHASVPPVHGAMQHAKKLLRNLTNLSHGDPCKHVARNHVVREACDVSTSVR